MATSLAQQLKKLAVPQTDKVVGEKKKVSLLFDSKEAATFDRDTFYEIGVHGLDELIKLNPKFAEFEETLFDVTSKNMQRLVLTPEANSKLDQEITKFMCFLSPYVLLSSSHKTLEWLIQRFNVHAYNVDQLLTLILPYYSTKIFVRVLQLIKIKDPSHRWYWLHPLQNAGVPLAQTVLFNHCASSNWFLSFICQIPVTHINICGEHPRALHIIATFCCTTVIGALTHCKEISETQVSIILSLLMNTLLSQFIEFSSMSILIAAELVKSAKLSAEVLQVLIQKLSKCPHRILQKEYSALMALIFLEQEENINIVPEKALLHLAKSEAFIPSLKKICDDEGQINHLLIALVRSSTQNILLFKNDKILKDFLVVLLSTIILDEETSKIVIWFVIQSYFEGVNIESKDDGPENTFQSLLQWYSSFVRNLEHQYPTAFDVVVKRSLKTIQRGKRLHNMRELLGFIPNINSQLLRMDIFEKLHHPTAPIRVEGLKYLIAGFDNLKEEDREFVQNIMRTKMQEDNDQVLEAVLKCRVSVLASIVGEDFFATQMMKIASKCWHTPQVLDRLKRKVLAYLCSEVSTRNPAVWFSVLPYLLPINDNEAKFAYSILKSKLSSKNQVIAAVLEGIPNESTLNASMLCSILMKVLSDDNIVPSVSELMNLVNENPIFKTEIEYKFITAILLTTASTKENIETKWKVLDEVMEIYASSKINYTIKSSTLSSCMPECMKVTQEKQLPIIGLLYCLFSLSKCIQLPDTVTRQHWWHISSAKEPLKNSCLLFYIRIFEVLIAGCMNDDISSPARKLYIDSLKNLFQNTYPDLHSQLGFLSNLWMAHLLRENYPDIMSYELQMRALLFGRSLLKATDKSISWTMDISEESIIPPLLISLSCPMAPVRISALECLSVLKYSLGARVKEKGYHCLVLKVLEYEEEIKIDEEQISVILYKLLSPDPDVKCNITSTQQNELAIGMNALFDCVFNDNTPSHMQMALLKILVHVNSEDIMKKLVRFGNQILSNAAAKQHQLDLYQSAILSSILSRFDQTSCISLSKETWQFFEAALLDFKTLMYNKKKITCPSVIAMNQISKDVFEVLPDLQQTILKILVSVATDADSPEVVSTVGHVVKKIVLDCKLVVIELERMKEAQAPIVQERSAKGRLVKRAMHSSIELLKTNAWREGTTLLELIQNKKKLHNIHQLLPVLFDLLKRCLEFEEQASVEYNKQLILSCILHTCTKLSSSEQCIEEIPESTINVELVVQCIRASQNPQTHHHALLVLSQLAGMMPEQVLHNIMAIFTFMGSSILRQDDSYSFQIISKVVDSVIPILIKANESGVDTVAPVLRVFVDALVDIPEHRQLPLFHKLIMTLGSSRFLWLLMALVIESQVKHNPGPDQFKDGIFPKKLEFVINLSLEFHPSVVIKNTILLMKYLKTLPIEKEQKDTPNSEVQTLGKVTKLFDVSNSSRSEFHHFKYAIIVFLSGVIGNSDFINQVAALKRSEVEKMEPLYSKLIQCVLQHIQLSVEGSESSVGKPTTKFWKCMLGQSYDLLDKVNALLLSDVFLRVILALLENPILAVSRKAMELMNARLQNEEFFLSCDTEDLLSLVTPLLKIINSINVDSSIDEQLNQQTALASMKLLTRLIAGKHRIVFKQVLETLTALLRTEITQGNVLASVLLCGAELHSCLKEIALGNLRKFMKPLLKVLKQEMKKNPDILLLAIVTSLYKLVESVPNFLSPYLEKLLVKITVLSSQLSQEQQTQKITPIVTKLELIKQKLAFSIPLRILVPVVKDSYIHLIKGQKYGAVGPLMVVLAESFFEMTSSDFNNLQTELSSFFLNALQFRSDSAENMCEMEIVDEVEGHVVKALVALVLKLSESSFRPLYYHMFHWASALDVHKERLITFYRVSHSIAECLKGLFVLFAGHFIQNAALLLGKVNLSKSKSLFYGTDKIAETNSLLLLDVLLKTLYSVFLYDSTQFLNRDRFDMLMQPLVDQLENTLGGLDSYKERTTNLLSPCLVQFAVVTADDTLWKQLNYQILLKTRHSLPVVRLMALKTICGIAQKLGDDFLPQLPETVPFLAELMEDEEEEVEKACVKVVQEMEEVLGEPLKKYF